MAAAAAAPEEPRWLEVAQRALPIRRPEQLRRRDPSIEKLYATSS